MPDPLALTMAREFRDGLAMQDDEMELHMLIRWHAVEVALLEEAEFLAMNFANLAPHERTLGHLAREQRYTAMLSHLLIEIDKYNGDIETLISDEQSLYARFGIQDAHSLMVAVADEGGAGVTLGFNRLPIEATENIVALARGGKPLAELLDAAYPLAAEGITRELISGVALGRNPRVTARRMIEKGASQAHNHAVLVARDQSLRAYRTATIETYRANGDILKGYQRVSTRSVRTCMACIALDGTEYELDVLMPLHPQDRCTMIPLIWGAHRPKTESAQDWFKRQDDDVQRKMMGPGRWNAWKEGKFDLDKLATSHDHAVWGPGAQETSLKALLNGEGGVTTGLKRKKKPKRKKKQQAAATTTQVERAPVVPSSIFPDSPDGLETIRRLGGSTGAQLVRDPATGRQYVMKRGSSEAHLREEYAADVAYQALGVNVPASRLYETAKGPVKLAEFIEGDTLDKVWRNADATTRARIKAQLQSDFAADALMANWDVMGAGMDNILVDKKGNLFRIDNGGALRFRAMGKPKRDAWGNYPVELWTLRDPRVNSVSAQIFGDMPFMDMVGQAERLAPRRQALLNALPDTMRADLGPVLSARLDAFEEMARTTRTMIDDAYRPEYLDRFNFHRINLGASGVVDRLPRQLRSIRNSVSNIQDENGVKFDNLRGYDSIMKHVTTYIDTNGGKYSLLPYWMGQQGGDSWSNGPRGAKIWLTNQRTLPRDAYWWRYGLEKSEKSYERAIAAAGSEKIYSETFTAWHAFNYEFVRTVELPNQDRARRLLNVVRTEDAFIMDEVYKIPMHARQVTMLRGAIESTSLIKPISVYGSEVTRQNVPYHRVMGTYFYGRYDGYSSGAFLGDNENEIVALLEGLPFDYEGSLRSGAPEKYKWKGPLAPLPNAGPTY